MRHDQNVADNSKYDASLSSDGLGGLSKIGLRWTSTKPTVPGKYWLAEQNTEHIYLVQVCDDGIIFFMEASALCPQDCWNGGQWSGPLEPPKETQ